MRAAMGPRIKVARGISLGVFALFLGEIAIDLRTDSTALDLEFAERLGGFDDKVSLQNGQLNHWLGRASLHESRHQIIGADPVVIGQEPADVFVRRRLHSLNAGGDERAAWF